MFLEVLGVAGSESAHVWVRPSEVVLGQVGGIREANEDSRIREPFPGGSGAFGFRRPDLVEEVLEVVKSTDNVGRIGRWVGDAVKSRLARRWGGGSEPAG